MAERSHISEVKVNELLNHLPCYALAFKGGGRIEMVNAELLKDLGYSEEEVVGKKKFADLLTVGSKIFFDTHFFPMIKLHGRINEIFLSFRSASGDDIPVLLNVALVPDGGSEIIHCGGIQITQRNRYEKEILAAKKIAEEALLENEALTHYKQQLEDHQQQLEAKLQELSRKNREHLQINMIMSHDLQEPLRKVSLFSNKLLLEGKTSIEQSLLKYLGKIQKACNRMRELVTNLQKFLSLSERKPEYSKVDIAKAIKEAARKLHIAENDPELTFVMEKMPAVRADEELLTEMFAQLLSNSIRYSDPVKERLVVSVSTDTVEQNIYVELEHKYKFEYFTRITYSDNGIGFNNRFAEEVFVLFRKAHDREEGLGLGLSFCKKISELHGGNISVNSAEGEGTTFTILLPAKAARENKV